MAYILSQIMCFVLMINHEKFNYNRLYTGILLPGFTAFVSAKKIGSRRTYQTSNNYSKNTASSSIILPMQDITDDEADVGTCWNSSPPPDEGCKWRKIIGREGYHCWGKHWRYAGEKTAANCSGFRIMGSGASPIKAQCWQRDWVNCSDFTCGPRPDNPCGPGLCPVDGLCLPNDRNEHCGVNCVNCTREARICFRGRCE
jgi:hypothetical protein